ncbi:DEAD/DEAH box helicase domain-containing protein [Cardiosporidium cionae]|uniref:DEAD/DEAH box helicase domain-containing protein n=1 Tax=Cardiosporidium cionae TaxID=476202 RepID=A0ABQ7J6E0_9APIC|nr:DEAD/DEAH box helicase domain-containing protein [Cardiosporidium cionae]|eukprot:KAF8819553.1 DEAD/DEAH box helicase domain-containing protein [Cardiosporidium cionae]
MHLSYIFQLLLHVCFHYLLAGRGSAFIISRVPLKFKTVISAPVFSRTVDWHRNHQPECPLTFRTKHFSQKNAFPTELSLLFPEEQAEKKCEDTVNTLTDGQPLFQEKEIHSSTLQVLEKQKLIRMTPIQTQVFDPIYNGNDLIGRSRTGTGKTLAFLLPLIEKLRLQAHSDGSASKKYPRLLILEPTRELSKQVEEAARTVCSAHHLSVVCCYGGVSYGPQESALLRGVDVVVGTPGRILDYLNKDTLKLHEIQHIVLDEADEMLNLGFAPDIERILSYSEASTKVQFLLFSATTPKWVHEVSKQYLKNPIIVDAVGKGTQRTATSVKNVAIETAYGTKGKAAILEDIVAVESKGGQTIVFTQTKREADELASEGAFKTFSVAVLHGDIGQSTRERIMERFRKGLFKVLVATDVAARGIDVGNVDLIIQAGIPTDPDTYVHRSGRAGRAGRIGTCVLLYTEKDRSELLKLERSCGIRFDHKKVPSSDTVLTAASFTASRQFDSVACDILPHFWNASEDILRRAVVAGVTTEEIIARCLAIISRKLVLQKKSLLSGLPDLQTLLIRNDKRQWRDSSDVFYWINRFASMLELNIYKNIGDIRLSAADGNDAFFDLPVEEAQQFLPQNKNALDAISSGREKS